MGLEPMITVSYTLRAATLAKHALRAFTAQEKLSPEDVAEYERLIRDLNWSGPELRRPTRVPWTERSRSWQAGYMAGLRARPHTEEP